MLCIRGLSVRNPIAVWTSRSMSNHPFGVKSKEIFAIVEQNGKYDASHNQKANGQCVKSHIRIPKSSNSVLVNI